MEKEVQELLSGIITDVQPGLEVFRIFPDQIKNTVARIIGLMGGELEDIRNLDVSQDKSAVRIIASIDKDSHIFIGDKEVVNEDQPVFALFGGQQQYDKTSFTEEADKILQGLGFVYYNDEGDRFDLFTKTKNKKTIQIEFSSDVVLAIVTNSNFADKFFYVTPVEKVVKKKKHANHSFKGRKGTIVIAEITRSYDPENQGYDPDQVAAWKLNKDVDDEDYNDEEDDE